MFADTVPQLLKVSQTALLLPGLLLAAAWGIGCASQPGERSSPREQPGATVLRGAVTYLPRIALPTRNTVTVRLLDVTQVDAPAIEIATQIIENAPVVPITFAIAYEPAHIDPRHTYCVAATIEVDGRVMFRSTERFRVFTGEARAIEPTVVVHLMGR